jgi:transcriptional regulator with XRE-family HTH domain
MSSRGYMIEHYGHLLDTPEAMAEGLTLDATEALCEMMEEAKLSRADLAKKMGVSKAYITQLLSGSRNMTLQTLATAAFHCGRKIKVQYVPLEQEAEREEAETKFDASSYREMLEQKVYEHLQPSTMPKKAGKLLFFPGYKAKHIKPPDRTQYSLEVSSSTETTIEENYEATVG